MSKRIFSELGTILLALAMAFLVWVAAVRQEDPLETKTFQQKIPLKVVGPAGDLFIVDQNTLPSTVQVKIRAPQSVWQNLSLNRIRASIDLSSYSAGLQDVPVQVDLLDRQASVVEVIPSDISVQLDPLAEKTMPVTPQVMDSPAQGYFNRLPVSTPISVTVKGAAQAVEQVDQVVARIFLNGSKNTVKQVVTLSPRNADDEIVANVTLEPANSVVTVPIDQRFGYKDVSVKANVVGQPASGYWVSSISVEPATVTLVGGPSVLKSVAGFVETAEIDLSGATENVMKRVPLNLPPGASLVVDETHQDSENSRSVLVTIGVSALTGGRTVQTGLTVQGVRQDLTWTAAPDTVEIILSGPLPILQNLSADDITVILDVFGLSPGTYRLQPEIIHPDGLTVTSLIPDTIEITLQPVQQATPSPMPFTTPTITVTPQITPSLSITLPVAATPTITGTPILTITPAAHSILTDTITGTQAITLTATPTPLAIQPSVSPINTPEYN